MKNMIKEETKGMREIIGRIKRRDLKGNSGQAIKNSSYQLTTILIAKIGTLLFTIIIARLMLPEIYGLYGLAISTILLLGVFSEVGIGTALGAFLSKNIDKFPGKAKAYFKQLTKWRISFLTFSVLLIIVLSKWISINYYQKPIYLALLAGAIYLPIVTIQSHLIQVFISINNFRSLLIGEIMFQVLRLTIIPMTIILFLSKISSTEKYLFWILIILAACYLASILYMIWKIKKNSPFKKAKIIPLSNKEQKDLKKFILPLTITALSGVFFGYIDQIMLGHYVESVFLGFYQASFNLIVSAAAIVSFLSIAMFPIFARLKGKILEKGFKKVRNITIIISIPVAIFTLVLAPLIITMIYGPMYHQSIIYLQIYSLLVISFPLISLYTIYYTSQKRTKIISILLIFSTIINISLNYIFINIGLQFNMSYAVIGACLATIISRFGYLGGLIIFRKWEIK